MAAVRQAFPRSAEEAAIGAPELLEYSLKSGLGPEEELREELHDESAERHLGICSHSKSARLESSTKGVHRQRRVYPNPYSYKELVSPVCYSGKASLQQHQFDLPETANHQNDKSRRRSFSGMGGA